MWRSILAVVAGYAVIGLLVVATDAIAAAVIPGFRTMTAPPLKYLITTLFTDSTYTVAGGRSRRRPGRPPQPTGLPHVRLDPLQWPALN